MTDQYRVVDSSYKTYGLFSSKTAAAKFIREQRAAGRRDLGMVSEPAPKKTRGKARPKTAPKPKAPAKPKAAAKPKALARPKAPAKPKTPKAPAKPKAAPKPKSAPKPRTVVRPRAKAEPNGMRRVPCAGFEAMLGVPGIRDPRIEAQPDGTFLVLFPEFGKRAEGAAERDLWAAMKAGELRRGTGWEPLWEGAVLCRLLEDGDGFFERVFGYAGFLMTSGQWAGGCATVVWKKDGDVASLSWVGRPEGPVKRAIKPGPYADVGDYLSTKGLPPLIHISFRELWDRTAGEGKTLAEAFADEPWAYMLPECGRALAEGTSSALVMTAADAARGLGVRL